MKYTFILKTASTGDISFKETSRYMREPKAVSVVGFKDAGKTRVVEALVAELSKRGYIVGTVKHTTEDLSFDKEKTDTWRHTEAGAIASTILSDKHTAIFLQRAITVQKAVDALSDVDFVVLEGFKTFDIVSRIIVPKEQDDIEKLSNGLEIAIVDANEIKPYGTSVQSLNFNDAKALADTVERYAFPLLAGLNCKDCGYNSCHEMGRAILAGEADYLKCIKYSVNISLKVNDSSVSLNSFVQSALRNIILGFIKTLKETGEPKHVEIEFEVTEDD
jgi:molybdopterin-guanine dinucleotide biosynthesis adapter protein